MNVREIIQQSIDYIENNLKAELTVDELCDAAGYSAVHYCRLFKTFVGVSPYEYINRRKLLHAVYEMANGRSKTEMAFDYGFQTYEAFTKHLKVNLTVRLRNLLNCIKAVNRTGLTFCRRKAL